MTFVPFEKIELTDAMKAGAVADTIQGKYYPKFTYLLNNGHFFINCDALADHKNHSFSPWFLKLLGLTMDMRQGNWTFVYRQNNEGVYNITNLIYNTGNMHLVGKGKLIKKIVGVKEAIEIDCYVEQYPVEIERLTVNEYNEQKGNYYEHRESFRMPDTVQPLAPAIQGLINRANIEIPVK